MSYVVFHNHNEDYNNYILKYLQLAWGFSVLILAVQNSIDEALTGAQPHCAAWVSHRVRMKSKALGLHSLTHLHKWPKSTKPKNEAVALFRCKVITGETGLLHQGILW